MNAKGMIKNLFFKVLSDLNRNNDYFQFDPQSEIRLSQIRKEIFAKYHVNIDKQFVFFGRMDNLNEFDEFEDDFEGIVHPICEGNCFTLLSELGAENYEIEDNELWKWLCQIQLKLLPSVYSGNIISLLCKEDNFSQSFITLEKDDRKLLDYFRSLPVFKGSTLHILRY